MVFFDDGTELNINTEDYEYPVRDALEILIEMINHYEQELGDEMFENEHLFQANKYQELLLDTLSIERDN